MLTLPEGYVNKFQDPNVVVDFDPVNATEKDFRELIVYLAVLKQKETAELTNKVSVLTEEVNNLTTAMEAKDDEVAELMEANQRFQEMNADLEIEVDSLKKEVATWSEEVINLQRYTREWGLRFNNIAETPNEDCIKLVEGALNKIGLGHVKIENAHRIGKKPADGYPRTIAARCHSRPERKEVLNKRKKLFEIGIPTFESLCKHDSDLKRRYAPVMKRLFDEGKRVYFAKGTLMVNGFKYAGPLPPPLPERTERPQRTPFNGNGPRPAPVDIDDL